MGRVDDAFMILLDVNHVLPVEDLANLQGITEAGEALLSIGE
jgi:hypothetical protein